MLPFSHALLAELKAVRFPELNLEEQRVYLDEHLRRMLFVFNTLDKFKLPEQAKVLDLGAKPYVLAYLSLAYAKWQYTGVGYSIKELRDAEARTAFYHELPVIKQDLELKTAQTLFKFPMWQVNIEKDPEPFPDGNFDAIVCTETVEHLVQDPTFLFSEIARLLKPTGKFIFSVPNAIYWGRLLKLLAGKNIDDPYSVHGPYGRHNRNYTVHEARQLCERAGLKVLRSSTYNFQPLQESLLKKSLRIFGNIIFSLFPQRRGKTVVVICEK